MEISLSGLFDIIFPPSTAKSDPLIPMEVGECKAWFANIRLTVNRTSHDGRQEVICQYPLYDLPPGSISLMVSQDVEVEDHAYRKPISSMYVSDRTEIRRQIDGSLGTSYSKVSTCALFPCMLTYHCSKIPNNI